MKPLKLLIQAFGPYPECEVVDFANLAQAGIFLIKGPTGSGKTTIFDAMSIALYGKSTVEEDKIRGGRNSLEVWRCNQAKWSVETRVEFTFQAGDKTYKFIRRLVPKTKKLDPVYAVTVLDENGDFKALDDCTKDAELSAKAEEIIGLNSSQFRQVVLLPQGKFERFLTAEANVKEEILCRLFDAGQWDRYAQNLYRKIDERKKELDEEKNAIQARLKDEEGDFESIEALNEYIERLDTELSELETTHVSYKGDEKRRILEEDKKLFAQFERLHELENKRDNLKKESDNIERYRNILVKADRAEKLRDPIKEIKSLQSNIGKISEDIRNTENKIPVLTDNAEKSEEMLKKHKADSPTDVYNTKIGELNAKRSIYENIDGLLATVKASEDAYNSAEKEYLEKRAELDILKNKAVSKKNAFDDLDDKARDYRNTYYACMYGDIASKLVNEKPCPVCGSTVHPVPAQKKKGDITREMVDIAEKNSVYAKKIWDEAEDERKQGEAELSNYYETLKSSKHEKGKATVLYEEATRNLVDGIGSSEELIAQIDSLQNAIHEYNSTEEKLQTEYTNHRDNLQNCKNELQTLSGMLNDYEELHKQKLAELSQILKQNAYASMEEVSADMITGDEKNHLVETVTTYETQLSINSEELAKQREIVEGKTEPDSENFVKRLHELDSELETYTKNKALLDNTINRLSKLSGELSKKSEHYKANIIMVEEDLNFARNLRGDTGIGLQRYVLGIMFNQIISEANSMLRMVHGGRYQLRRTDEKGNTNKRGLELRVLDNRCSDENGRPVSSLSGGEKFLVSLSLSIGMSAIAQKSGFQIEALFIDEGFGTLDDESIADAMNIIEHVQKSNGMIGIISHVSILESNIQKHVVVEKSKDGSHIRVC